MTDKSQGTKHDEGKSRVDLIPPGPILQVGEVLAHGVKEYGARNWEKGLSWSRCIGAAERHILKFKAGEDLDYKTGKHHLAHAICELLFLLEFDRTHPELDDRTHNPIKEFPE